MTDTPPVASVHPIDARRQAPDPGQPDLPTTLPHDDEAERALLAAVMLDAEALGRLTELEPGHFYGDHHRLIFGACKRLQDAGVAPDLVTVTGVLRETQELARVGGAAYVSSLLDALPDVANVEHYAAIVRHQAGKRRALQLLTTCSTALQLGRGLDRIERLGLELVELAATVGGGRPMLAGTCFKTLGELLADPSLLEMPEAVVPGLAWAGRLTMVAAREKAGKSTLVAWAAAAVSRGRDWLGDRTTAAPVLWVGMEEALGDAVRRFGEADADPAMVHVLDGPALPYGHQDILAAVERVKPALIVVDSLAAYGNGRVEDWSSAGNVTPIMLELLTLARQSGAAVVLLHHAAKASGSYRDSTAIGAVVDVILSLEIVDADSPVRKIRAVGRIPDLVPYSVTFAPGVGYQSDGDVLSTRDLVYRFVAANAGATKRQIRQAIQRDNNRIDEDLRRLTDEGQLQTVSGTRGSIHHYTRLQIAAGEHEKTLPDRNEPVSTTDPWDAIRRQCSKAPADVPGKSNAAQHQHGPEHGQQHTAQTTVLEPPSPPLKGGEGSQHGGEHTAPDAAETRDPWEDDEKVSGKQDTEEEPW